MSELKQIISQFSVLFDESRFSQAFVNFKRLGYSPLWEVFAPTNSNNSYLADSLSKLNRSDFSQSVVLYPVGSQKYPRLFTAALFWGKFDVSPPKISQPPLVSSTRGPAHRPMRNAMSSQKSLIGQFHCQSQVSHHLQSQQFSRVRADQCNGMLFCCLHKCD